MSTNRNSPKSSTFIEVSHEAVLFTWKRAKQWQIDEYNDIVLMHAVTEATKAHSESGGGLWEADDRLYYALTI